MILFYLISNSYTFDLIFPIKYQNARIYLKTNEIKDVKSVLLTDKYFYCVDLSNNEKLIFHVEDINKIAIKN
jgi:hypothetical protein